MVDFNARRTDESDAETVGSLLFLLGTCRAAVDAGLFCVYTADKNLPYWHASLAKNTAHKVATEDVLVNLDGDNLIRPQFVADVAKRFNAGATAMQYEGEEEGTSIVTIVYGVCRMMEN